MKRILGIWKILLAPMCAFMLFSASCENTPPPGNPDAGLYHNYQEVTAELAALQSQFPAIAKVMDLGNSVQGRKIQAIKISDNVGTEEEEPEILFVGGHHAREWIAVDVPLLLAKHLLQNYNTNIAIKKMVDDGEIWIVPMLNPDGHQYSVTNDRLWRKNRRNNNDGTFGVDLNRNYSYHWGGPGSSGSTFSETYRGPVAFSEPETGAIKTLAAAHEFKAMLSYHNFSQLVLFPWGHTNSNSPDHALMLNMARKMADEIRGVHNKNYTPQQSSDLYLASGDATDWLYGETSVPSFTIELRPRSSSPGFILPESEIQSTFEENLPAALYLIEWTQAAAGMTVTM